MKKLWSLALRAALPFALAACCNTSSSGDSGDTATPPEMLDETEESPAVSQDSPSVYGENTDGVYWEGTYNTDTMALWITDYDGKTFEFEMVNYSTDTRLKGAAALDPEYPSVASGDGFSFELYPGKTGVAVDGADGFAENFVRTPPGMLGETETIDELAVYQSVFADLKKQIATGDYKWEGVREASGLGGLMLANYRYLLRDIDSDGARELFIFADEDILDRPYSLIIVFTITGGEPEILREFWSRSRGYLTVGNYVLNEWSNGADDSGVSVYEYFENAAGHKFFSALDDGKALDDFDSNPDYTVDESIEPLPIPE